MGAGAAEENEEMKKWSIATNKVHKNIEFSLLKVGIIIQPHSYLRY